MGTQDLDAGVFGTEIGAVCRESTPRARMAYCLALFTTRQQYCVVLGRFCVETVTGEFRSLKLEVES